jgi:cytoskeletal protein RodZ
MLTVGDILKEERLKRNLTFEQIEKITKIRKKNLEAIEEGNWKLFSSKTYIVGIINTYSRYLGLDANKLNAFFRREYERNEDLKFKAGVDTNKVTPQKKKNFKIIVVTVSLIFLIYFGYQIKVYLTPPKVQMLQPTQKTYTIEDKIKLVGLTEKEAIVFVNGDRVYLDENNKFSTYIPLTQPKNDVTIEVTGANGKKTTLKEEYFKKQK